MSRSVRRPARPRAAGALAALLMLVGLGIVAVAGASGPASASRASESSGLPDRKLGRSACTLMGRETVKGGCSRFRCLRAGETIRLSPNAETCLIGGRNGAAYGNEIDFRTCARLHRRWIAAVNLCASNPRRGTAVIEHAPQCLGRFSTYVVTSRTTGGRATRREAEGRYDACERPSAVAALRSQAKRTGTTLASLVRADTAAPAPGRAGPTVLMVGDSLTWRGTDELARLRPDWALDGIPGRNLSALGPRLARFTDAHDGPPTGLVIALGTNPARGFDAGDLRAVVDSLPDATPVMIVTPYRDRRRTSADQVRSVDRAAAMLLELAQDRPATCLADWRSLVATDSALLVDGTHQIRRVEGTWARLVSSRWTACTSTLTTDS